MRLLTVFLAGMFFYIFILAPAPAETTETIVETATETTETAHETRHEAFLAAAAVRRAEIFETDPPPKEVADVTYWIWLIASLIICSYAFELWGRKPKKGAYKSPWKRITSHFVAAIDTEKVDEEGRTYTETEILNKNSAKSIIQGRTDDFDGIDKQNILDYLEKDQDYPLDVHAAELVKYWWARGEGTDRIYNRKIGMGKTYIRACVTCYNARYPKEE